MAVDLARWREQQRRFAAARAAAAPAKKIPQGQVVARPSRLARLRPEQPQLRPAEKKDPPAPVTRPAGGAADNGASGAPVVKFLPPVLGPGATVRCGLALLLDETRLCVVCRKPLPADAHHRRTAHEECASKRKRQMAEGHGQDEKPLPPEDAELAYEHDEKGNLVRYGPACLVCGKPVVQSGKSKHPSKVHPGCVAERDRRIKAAFNPEPTAIATAAAVPAEKPRQFSRQCIAVDANSGARCKLLAPHDGFPHRTERGAFHALLQPGATPHLVEQLVQAAGTQRENALGVEKKSNAQEQRESRARRRVNEQ